MTKEDIKIKYLKKIKEIKKHNKLYFEKSNPEISDSDYDKLKREISNIEKANPRLKLNSSPTNIVGFKPSKQFEKFKHKVPMLSLSNAFDEEDLINFEKKIFNYLNKEKLNIV